MIQPKSYTSVFLQLTDTVEKGVGLLDESFQKEIKQFVLSQQHDSGAFTDRSAVPDIYYSLFGFILAKALKLERSLNALSTYILKKDFKNEKSLIHKSSLILLSDYLPGNKKKIKLFYLLRNKDNQANSIYRIFLFSLVFDARHGKNGLLHFFARLVLKFFKEHGSSPASIVAAMLVARQIVGLKTKKQEQQLISFLAEDGGFRSFSHVGSGDMLATGVSLFALKNAKFDLREIAPSCLNFIQLNFSNGAFLSGDGDQTRDLEYTFYGLLALGSLA